jgi:hypothetical protein
LSPKVACWGDVGIAAVANIITYSPSEHADVAWESNVPRCKFLP